MSEVDPIHELLEGLAHRGRPPLAWVVRWSQGDHEPVAAAWRASRDPWSMALLLKRARCDWVLGPYQLVNARGLRQKSAADAPMQYVVLEEGRTPHLLARTAEGAAEIRRRVPHPPSLAQLLAAR